MFRQLTPVTKAIIILNALVFLLTFIINEELMYHLAAYFPLSESFKFWQIITHMFVHGGWMHLLFNMFTLLSFGPVLEKVLGEKKFLWFYFACGLGSFVVFNVWNFFEIQQLTSSIQENNINPAQIYSKSNIFELSQSYFNSLQGDEKSLMQSLITPMVGASGAIFGVVAAFSLLFPNAELIFMFIPFPIKAKYLFPLIVVGSLFLGIRQYDGDNVAHFAHLGGALIGALWILQWKKKNNRMNRF